MADHLIYNIEYKKSVAKDLRKLARSDLQQVIRRIEALAADPRPPGSIMLQGQHGLYRVRQGDYRIIYSIHDEIITVLIIKIGHRREIYGNG